MKAQIFNHAAWVDETSPAILIAYYKSHLLKAGFHLENVIEKHFTPQGYTALFLLSESHFAIHTFPEENTTYIELSSCVEKPFDAFMQNTDAAHRAQPQNRAAFINKMQTFKHV